MTPREIDALVAEKVMGMRILSTKEFKEEFAEYKNNWPENWTSTILTWNQTYDWHQGFVFNYNTIKNYSTDIKAAWEVVEKLDRDEDGSRFWCIRPSFKGSPNMASFENQYEDCRDYSRSEFMPHAICLAALKAKGVEI